MMKSFKKSMLAAAVVGAMSAMPAAYAIPGAKIDNTGSSGAGVVTTSISFDFGNALYRTIFDAPQIGAIFAQSTISNIGGSAPAGSMFTYELKVPVLSSVVNANQVGLTNNLLDVTGYFRIFVDKILGAGNQPDGFTGTGFGTASGTSAGQTMILEGTVRLTGTNNLTQDTTVVEYLGLTNGKDVLSHELGGKLAINVMVTSQDSAYFRTDMIGTALDVDMQLGSFGPQAAFNSLIPVSDAVAGLVPHFATNPSTLVITDETSVGQGDIGLTVTAPLNDLNCNNTIADPPTATCDAQMQVSGNASLLTQFAPEPGSLALLGLGLAGLGFASRRANRRAA